MKEHFRKKGLAYRYLPRLDSEEKHGIEGIVRC